MTRKRLFAAALALVLIFSGYFITAYSFPKYAARYPLLVLLFVLDFYVWASFKRKVFSYHKVLKLAWIAFYWSPVLLMVVYAAFLLLPIKTLPPGLNTFLWGYVFSFYVAKLFSALFLLLADGIRFFVHFSKAQPEVVAVPADSKGGKTRISRRNFLQKLSLATGALVLSTMFTGMFKWVHNFNIKRLFVRIPNLPASFDGYRIAQISDLHLGSWSGSGDLAEAVQLINESEVDLIVFTGDLVNFRTEEAFRFKENLRQLRAKDGVLAILGNHDYGDYVKWESKAKKQQNMRDLYAFYSELGWRLLRNEHHILTRETEKLALLGVENWGSNPRFPQLGDISKAAKGLGPIKPLILLSHDPSHWEAEVLKNHPDIQLTLSGHTHGFQFGIEIPGIKWSPAQYLYKQWAGLYENPQTGQMLYVNRGLGSIGYPGRIGILPEITLFELHS